MGGTQPVSSTATDSDIEIEWTAGWPPRARLLLLFATLAIYVPLCGLALWHSEVSIKVVILAGPLVTIATRSVVSKRTYRVSPTGLAWYRNWWLFESRRLIPWSQFDGFSVTDDAIVLHRLGPHLDIRCRRWDVSLGADEEDVIAAVRSYVDRRES